MLKQGPLKVALTYLYVRSGGYVFESRFSAGTM